MDTCPFCNEFMDRQIHICQQYYCCHLCYLKERDSQRERNERGVLAYTEWKILRLRTMTSLQERLEKMLEEEMYASLEEVL